MEAIDDRGDSRRDQEIMEAELADLKTAFEIASELVGCSPNQQALIGQNYTYYANSMDKPNTRELVQRLLCLGVSHQAQV